MADLCSAFSLSEEKEPSFSSPCDHDHDNTCSQCEELKATMSDIQEYLERVDLGLPDEESDDLRHMTDQAVQNVLSWKAHQLRNKRQDMARIAVISQPFVHMAFCPHCKKLQSGQLSGYSHHGTHTAHTENGKPGTHCSLF